MKKFLAVTVCFSFLGVFVSAQSIQSGAVLKNTLEKRAGLHPECLLWIRERKSPCQAAAATWRHLRILNAGATPFHTVGIPYPGLSFIDDAELDALARITTARKNRKIFITIAPWRITGGTSSPINPLVIF